MNYDVTVAIIGTGFSGMGAAIELARHGISDFVLLEKADDIGGTWRDNQYPGACCDVPSVLYSFSFEPWPHWTRRFAPAREIHDYQYHVMEKYGLKHRTRLGFEVNSATRKDGVWHLLGTNGKTLKARFVISAIGALHLPKIPEIKGLSDFRGRMFHSSAWDRNFDWTGKNVVVIGSAASAVQIVPAISGSAGNVTVMQRTPNHLFPRDDKAFPDWLQKLFRTLPLAQKLLRWKQYCLQDFLFLQNFRGKDSFGKRYVHRIIKKHMSKVDDPDLRARITPDYEIGCKRILLSDDYLPALEKPNVELVTAGIDYIDEIGVVTKRGRHIPADLIVLATGFHSEKLMGDMTVTGEHGRTVEDIWKTGGIRAYRTIALHGFPDFFMMYGPGANLGHSSIILMVEAQARAIARLVAGAKDSGVSIEAGEKEQRAWNVRLQRALAGSVWSTGCSSWYKDERGHIFSLWPHSVTRYARDMKKTTLADFTITPNPDRK